MFSLNKRPLRGKEQGGIALDDARGHVSLPPHSDEEYYADICFGKWCFTIAASGLVAMLISLIGLIVLLYAPFGGN